MAGKILIVDDVSSNRIVLKVKLVAARYETFQASSGGECLESARSLRPDLILLDVLLPDMDGYEVCRRLKAAPATRAIPVVMVTALTDDAARVKALQAGAEDIFAKPLDDLVLLARVRSVLRARETQAELGLRLQTYNDFGMAEPPGQFAARAHIALISGRPGLAQAWRRDLAALLGDRITIHDATEALDAWDNGVPPDLVVIPADIAGRGDGLRLMSELRSRHATRYAAVCIVLAPGARETAAMALDLGANDLIEESAGAAEMAHRVATQIARKRQNDRLRATLEDGLKLAMTDPLTGLHNRRYALPHLARIAAHALGAGRGFAVMVLDIDRFKAVNDTWGHAAGDAVLREVAARFRLNLRAVDLVARIGGEEFLIALPDCALANARKTAERLRRVVEERPVAIGEGASISVTLSIGLAMGGAAGVTPGGTAESVDSVIAVADRALLRSKAEGRNQVTVSRTAA